MKFVAVVVIETTENSNGRKPDCEMIKRLIKYKCKSGIYEFKTFRGGVDLEIVEADCFVIEV